ncbi:MAG: DUF3188 domain-containing protein [Lactobacillales bacterium]|jgi:thiol:disulfide interchange protein|nr:DUF3188 domain-containing protein [Lactobacillales bacterium]
MVKNGLGFISVGLLMFLVMGVNKSTGKIDNFGILLTSVLLVIVGIALFIRGNNAEKKKKEDK